LSTASKAATPASRLAAVRELVGWLTGDDPARALTADQTLRQIADTDNPTVAAVARGYFVGHDQRELLTTPYAHSIQEAATTKGMAAEKAPKPLRSGHDRARLLADAERSAQSMEDSWAKAEALCDVAGAVAATDRDHTARLLTDAERIAQSLDSPSMLKNALAGKMAAIDPDRAERIAQSITDPTEQAWAVRDVAAGWRPPTRSARN
jgi:hypothetical protein